MGLGFFLEGELAIDFWLFFDGLKEFLSLLGDWTVIYGYELPQPIFFLTYQFSLYKWIIHMALDFLSYRPKVFICILRNFKNYVFI